MGIGFGGFDFMFTLVPVIIGIGFVTVFGIIIVTAIKGGIQWSENNNSPILIVDAKVVSKRTAVSNHTHHHSDNAAAHYSSSTTYYATFEVESGDRMELRVPDAEYGMLVEGDVGRLTFQGTRYKGYERLRQNNK